MGVRQSRLGMDEETSRMVYLQRFDSASVLLSCIGNEEGLIKTKLHGCLVGSTEPTE